MLKTQPGSSEEQQVPFNYSSTSLVPKVPCKKKIILNRIFFPRKSPGKSGKNRLETQETECSNAGDPSDDVSALRNEGKRSGTKDSHRSRSKGHRNSLTGKRKCLDSLTAMVLKTPDLYMQAYTHAPAHTNKM